MSEVKVEYEQTISRGDAAVLLSQLARAFSGNGDAEFPFGPGTIKLDVPGRVQAELEVEVEDDAVEVEIEFKWPLSQRQAKPKATVAPRSKAPSRPLHRSNGTTRTGHAARAKRN